MASSRQRESGLGFGSPPCDKMNDSTKTVGPVQRRTMPRENFNAFNIVVRNRNITMMMSGLRIVEANAIQQNQDLFERTSPNAEIGLRIFSARFQLDTAHILQNILYRFCGKRFDFLPVNDIDHPCFRTKRTEQPGSRHCNRLALINELCASLP